MEGVDDIFKYDRNVPPRPERTDGRPDRRAAKFIPNIDQKEFLLALSSLFKFWTTLFERSKRNGHNT